MSAWYVVTVKYNRNNVYQNVKDKLTAQHTVLGNLKVGSPFFIGHEGP